MTKQRRIISDPKDPFDERPGKLLRLRHQVLGGKFEFASDSRELLRIADVAYAGLHRHRLSASTPPFQLRLRLSPGRELSGAEPPAMRMSSGAGLLYGVIDAANFAVLHPQTRAGVVSFSRELLGFPYHARYELLEFSVFTLASRAQGLVPLHAGCVGVNGKGILLIGDSGAGKSTLALHGMLQGLDFLSEDAVFVMPRTLLATGVANFLHVRADSLPFLGRPSLSARIQASPVIRRRSGVEKFEVDLRHKNSRTARTPLTITRIVFVSKKPARRTGMLRSVSRSQALDTLAASQPYASRLPSWAPFLKRLARIDAFELRRGRHPAEAADVLRTLLES